MARALAIVGYLAVLLAVDTQVGAGGQLVLGGCTWIALCSRLSERVTVAAGSGARRRRRRDLRRDRRLPHLGRLHVPAGELPSFVPPAHGLVYLAGASLAAAASSKRLQVPLVRVALVLVLVWGIAGITVLPRPDVGGALGAGLLAIYLLRGRAPEIYAGVFIVVAWLELYGTAIGTWRWAAEIPGTSVSREPAERCRLRLRVVRHRRACGRAALASPRRGRLWTCRTGCLLGFRRQGEADLALGLGRADRELADRAERHDQLLRPLGGVRSQRDEAEARL